jgi:predicted transcriptional regulator
LQKSLETNDRTIRYDANIAERIGVSKATMSLYRRGGNMSIYIAVKVAELIGIEPMETISATMYHQTKSEEEKTFWLNQYQNWTTRNRKAKT